MNIRRHGSFQLIKGELTGRDDGHRQRPGGRLFQGRGERGATIGAACSRESSSPEMASLPMHEGLIVLDGAASVGMVAECCTLAKPVRTRSERAAMRGIEMGAQEVVHGSLGRNCLHLCVDMQRLFGPGYPWEVPWLEKVVPAIETLCIQHPESTIFTMFIPAARAGEGRGAWARDYHRWAATTLDEIGADAVRLVPLLERFTPPADVVDKHVCSPWMEGRLDGLLAQAEVYAIVITGGETDVCVLATALGAIDRGLRVILATDALCSSSDATHDALMELYLTRFREQVEVATVEDILDQWH